MGDVVANPNAFMRGIDLSVKRFDKQFSNTIRRVMTESHRRLLDKTPVHTGQAVMNYIATDTTPYNGPALEAGDAVEATNKLPIGVERLRASAVARAKSSLQSVNYDDPYRNFYITNKAPHIGGLENGELPEDPYTPRSPAGMFGVTLQEISSMLSSGRL